MDGAEPCLGRLFHPDDRRPRALEGEQPVTLRTLERGGWIDDVPGVPGAAADAAGCGGDLPGTGRIVATDECAQMRFYRHRALTFVRDHPGQKAKLAAVAAKMLWQPSVTRTEGRRGRGTFLDTARTWIEGAYAVVLFALAVVGAFFLPRGSRRSRCCCLPTSR